MLPSLGLTLSDRLPAEGRTGRVSIVLTGEAP
jgi:hypothetical protein